MVALGYAAAQLAVGMHRVFLGWDEILYVSQFSREVPAGFMDAPRAWGVPLIVAPVAATTTSAEAVRIFMILLIGLGVFCAFRTWLRARDTVAVPLAALLLCSLWVSIFYGNAAMPNMLTALCALAAVALFVRVYGPGARRARPVLLGLAATFAAMSMVRPLDTVWIGLPLIAAACLHRPWRRPAVVVAILAGSAIGWLPWVIESYVRFGGVLPRLAEIARWNGRGLHAQGLRHLQSFSSGRLLCDSSHASCGEPTLNATLAWAALVILVGVGLLALRGGVHLPAAVIAVVVAAANAAAYLFLSQLANPRFLLPTYALLVLPAAEGLRWLSLRLSRVGPLLAGGIVAAFAGTQLAMANGVAVTVRDARDREIQRAKAVIGLPLRRPCVLYGRSATQIAYLAHCRYWRPYVKGVPQRPPAARVVPVFDRMRARGLQVVVVTRGKRLRDFPAGWRHVRLLPDQSWHAHLPPG
ncbi:MAG: hypothetical protein JWO67_3727 [Streptosporangiaceae bacterium]|nr:hypothetical protein [Streptosporangiaceae bacterium]